MTHNLLTVLLGLFIVGVSVYSLVRARQGFMVTRSGRKHQFRSGRERVLTFAVGWFGVLLGVVLVMVSVAFGHRYV